MHSTQPEAKQWYVECKNIVLINKKFHISFILDFKVSSLFILKLLSILFSFN